MQAAPEDMIQSLVRLENKCDRLEDLYLASQQQNQQLVAEINELKEENKKLKGETDPAKPKRTPRTKAVAK